MTVLITPGRRAGRLFECGDYSRAASDQANTVVCFKISLNFMNAHAKAMHGNIRDRDSTEFLKGGGGGGGVQWNFLGGGGVQLPTREQFVYKIFSKRGGGGEAGADHLDLPLLKTVCSRLGKG